MLKQKEGKQIIEDKVLSPRAISLNCTTNIQYYIYNPKIKYFLLTSNNK